MFHNFFSFGSCRDVAWWLSISESTPPPRVAPVISRGPQASVAQIETRSVRAEVENLNEEVLYLLRFQNFLEVTILHLKSCRNALDQCSQVHYDEHLGHVQFWEFLNKHATEPYNIPPTDRSRMKHICRQYLEKVSNLFLLAGVPVRPPQGSSSTFEKVSKNVPQIKYSAFRDQMMYRFKDSWNVVNAPPGRKKWKDSIQTPVGETSQCCRGDFTDMSSEWTQSAALLFQDVLGRLHDHSSALFLAENTGNRIDPIKQREISKLINSFRSNPNTALAFLPECERTFFLSSIVPQHV
jgi:hypothetical protein